MHCRQCDVIGCPEAAVWERAAQLDDCLEDSLCNACWLKMAANHPERAACYRVCNTELATPQERPSGRLVKQTLGGEVVVIQ